MNKLLLRLYTDLEVEASKRMKHLKLTDLQPTTEEFPCLRHVKGAQIRAFAPVCLELCRLYKDSRVDKHRLAMVSSLNQLYTLMGEHSWKKWCAKQGSSFWQPPTPCCPTILSVVPTCCGKAVDTLIHRP